MAKRVQHTDGKLAAVGPRRRFLNAFWAALGSLALLEAGWLSLSLFRTGKEKKDAEQQDHIVKSGTVDQFAPGSVTAIPKGQFYLACLADGSFLALSRTCTHLGCAVPWDEEAKKFICPCHGSSFSITGEVLSPPATRPLNSHPLRIENGVILVNTAKTEQPIQNGIITSVKA